jgi:uncharacterized metal-binding protein YceD (DUF177 family)
MTDKRDDFVLRLSGVELGSRKYSMICDKSFFELTGLNEIEEGCINVLIETEKSAKTMALQFHFNGEVTVVCDRCLELFTLPLEFDDFLIVNFVSHIDESFQNDENIWQIHEKAYELDLTHFLYESIELALPTQLLHPEDENGNPICNPNMLEKLAELAPNTNAHHDTETDPRWDVLNKLKI